MKPSVTKEPENGLSAYRLDGRNDYLTFDSPRFDKKGGDTEST